MDAEDEKNIRDHIFIIFSLLVRYTVIVIEFYVLRCFKIRFHF
jgi:hypothetical protein